MELDKLLNEMIEMIEVSKDNNISASLLRLVDKDKWLYITQENIDAYNLGLELVYNYDEKIRDRFSRKTIYKHVNDKVFEKKNDNNYFNKADTSIFFKMYLDKKPKDCKVIAPISGIRLVTEDKVNVSIFEVGKTEDLLAPINNRSNGYYISVNLRNIYDDKMAIGIAENKFSDFIRIIAFIAGKEDKSIYIKVGLPVYPDMSPEKVYTESTSYNVIDVKEDDFGSLSMNNVIADKVPIDNPFFQNNLYYNNLWNIYEEKVTKKNKMNKRLLNASIAIGESMLSKNVKNSIIYTSMAFETLFSLNEASLFQPSIADKLAGNLAFIVGTTKERRLQIIKDVKKFYALRSALVHGANPQTNNDYIIFNRLLRASINELLNNKKYEKVNDVSSLYEMLKEAQNSY